MAPLFARVLGIVYIIVGVLTVVLALIGYAGLAWALPGYFGLAVFAILGSSVLISVLACVWALALAAGLLKGWGGIVWVASLFTYLPSMVVALALGGWSGLLQLLITIMLFVVMIAARGRFKDEGSL